MRLDEILIKHGSAAPAQIREALDCQKSCGGRLETHLLRFGYVPEKQLVTALSQQFNCEGICLSRREIPQRAVDCIPAHIARTLLILPFDYDPTANILKIACENPRDDHLRETLNDIAGGKKIQLFVAVGIILKCAIVNHYRTVEIKPTDETICQIESATPIKSPSNTTSSCHILVLAINGPVPESFQRETEAFGYHMTITQNTDEFEEHYRRSRPDLFVIMHTGTIDEINTCIDNLILRDIFIDQIPTFLLVKATEVNDLNSLLNDGIEDILPLDDSYNSLIIKMNRVRERNDAVSRQRRSVIRELGTHGTLEDMNVIDLLQMMGPSRKTARISISGHGRQLTIFLNAGNIIYAECDGKIGPDAVYQGLSWNRGVWSVDPITDDDLPEPNNELPNESILLEGCRLLDEQSRREESKSNLRW